MSNTTKLYVNILSATKNITRSSLGFSVLISLYYADDSYEKVCFNEDLDHNILVSEPIKYVSKDLSGVKTQLKSYAEYAITNELLTKVDNVINLFDSFEGDDKKVLL